MWSGISLGMRPANERHHYYVTILFIGWPKLIPVCYLLWVHESDLCSSLLSHPSIVHHCRRLCRHSLRRRCGPQILVDTINFNNFCDGFHSHFWHDYWPWPIDYLIRFGWFLSWPLPSIVKVKYGICYISAKNGPIATKRKANISIDLWNVTYGFDLDPDPDLWIFKVKCDLDLWPHTRPWPWIAVSQNGRAS